MARIDFTSQRLFLDAALTAGAMVPLDRAQANYLFNVLRFSSGSPLLVFNGRDGEWRAEAMDPGRKSASLRVVVQTRAQPGPSPLHYCFAPLKHARLDYMVQKAVEMGAGVLQPVITRHTQATRVNGDRMRANAIEAAEQCGVLAVPEIREALPFDRWLAEWEQGRTLVFCDEDAEGLGPCEALAASRSRAGDGLGVLIGPEGGFASDERAALMALPGVLRVSLGPRILRADTAAVAALALVQAVLGDWQPTPA